MSDSKPHDRAVTALGLAFLALCLGYAIDIKDGDYAPWAIVWLTVSLLLAVVAIALPKIYRLEKFSLRALPLILALIIAGQGILLVLKMRLEPQIHLAFAVIVFLGFAQFFPLRGLRYALMVIMGIAFFFAGEIAFNTHAKDPRVDVFMFQWNASYSLAHGLNPYTFKYPNIYGPIETKLFYGPGVVDSNGYLTVGFPYPPLSALMTFPAYLIGGDVRYAQLIAMALSAILMAMARPGRIGALAGAVFLLTPRALYVLNLSWTEPLLVLTFSLVMFCACRWPKALPYALGFYFSTKQYTVLALPLLPLLIEGPNAWKSLRPILFKAGVIVAVINLPFLVWNVHEFVRALVVFQFLQPFRTDALSYLVLIYKHTNGLKLPIWISVVPLVPAIWLNLRRAIHSPAGFAAGIALIHLVFFAFNKQAFCNYYYFVIATACWSIAAARLPALNAGATIARAQ